MKNILAVFLLAIAVACGSSSKSNFTPPPNPPTTPVAKIWVITLSGANPESWSFAPTTAAMQSLPTATCMADFTAAGAPNLPASFGSCGLVSGMTSTNASWIQSAAFGATTGQLYAGATVYYYVTYTDGSSTSTLAGQGTFDGTKVTGNLACVDVNGATCTWGVLLTAE
jgi:hypothetical protein